MDYKILVEKAYDAMTYAYVPYSKFKVGAALLTKSGKVFTGCNVESASLGATNCAERTAVYKAISEGYREFEAIAIVSSGRDFTYPCGICRQVLVEFGKDIDIIVAKDYDYEVYKIDDLLPRSFTGIDIK
ncbi:cytidine deaminase [Fusibacter ferrireducens]|uniref:Cytidine deaminase n=1 Tax=Fusibacter ferrireducens TaxID=2785058 RepID=A0ABR9ZXP6_9FIRM|nr:cytidine deaminase [Fusibacter ferrireducens]MBF4694923.1 cytidine deaminase [Fusibacter ferrireducens]